MVVYNEYYQCLRSSFERKGENYFTIFSETYTEKEMFDMGYVEVNREQIDKITLKECRYLADNKTINRILEGIGRINTGEGEVLYLC